MISDFEISVISGISNEISGRVYEIWQQLVSLPMAIIRAIISVRESHDPGFTYYLRFGGNSVVVVASATAGGNSICMAQLPPDIRCQ